MSQNKCPTRSEANGEELLNFSMIAGLKITAPHEVRLKLLRLQKELKNARLKITAPHEVRLRNERNLVSDRNNVSK